MYHIVLPNFFDFFCLDFYLSDTDDEDIKLLCYEDLSQISCFFKIHIDHIPNMFVEVIVE